MLCYEGSLGDLGNGRSKTFLCTFDSENVFVSSVTEI